MLIFNKYVITREQYSFMYSLNDMQLSPDNIKNRQYVNKYDLLIVFLSIIAYIIRF